MTIQFTLAARYLWGRKLRTRSPILRANLQTALGAQPHVPVNNDAALAEFEKIAEAFPIFRLASNKAAQPTQPREPRG